MSDVFISYSSANRDQARDIAERLEALGFSVWWDRNIPPGRNYDEVIEEAIQEAGCVVVLWTSDSVESSWVKNEAAYGAQQNKLVPVLLEDVGIPLEFRRIQFADLTDKSASSQDTGFESLVGAIESRLGSAPRKPPSIGGMRRSNTQQNGRGEGWKSLRGWRKWAIGLGLLVVAGVAIGQGLSGESDLSRDEAAARLERLVSDIGWSERPEEGKAQLDFLPPDVCSTLPSLEEFPVVVTSPERPGQVVVEILASTEKSGSGTDGWLVEVAEAFNSSNTTLANGLTAKVEIRSIASGIAYEFISCGVVDSGGFTPSNELWARMAEARGARMTEIDPQLVPNVGGIVLRTELAEQLGSTRGALDSAALIDAVAKGNVSMGYTNPYASSTGLNFLVTVLGELTDQRFDQLDDPATTDRFEQFQRNIPYVAMTTLQIRESVEQGGQLEAFVMEYQTFIQTPSLATGYEFVPFGIAHDNPLYAFGPVTGNEIEVLDLLSEFSEREQFVDLAKRYGFDPPSYSPNIAAFRGTDLLKAQQVWKERKDGGKPVMGVFVADISGSMSGSRIRALKEALLSGMNFIGEDNYVGLVLFSDQTTVVVPIEQFTEDHQRTFKAAVEKLTSGGGTAMYDGVAVATSILLRAQEGLDVKPTVIVLTDGVTTSGHDFGDVEAIIKGLSIPVYTIGFEADIDELARLSSLVEAASINASEGNVQFKIGELFNAQF